MLNKRQNQIIIELAENAGTFMKTTYFSNKMNVSARTIQNDINAIKEDTKGSETIFSIETIPQNGSRLNVINQAEFTEYVCTVKERINTIDLNIKADRVNHLLHFLLNQNKPISLAKCAEYVFVSKTTIISDIKDLDNILSKYSLTSDQVKGDIVINGLERDKRMCLIDNDNDYVKIPPSDSIMNNDIQQTNFIKKTFLDELLRYQYEISDHEFQDLIIWTNVSIKRIRNSFVLKKEDIHATNECLKELEIARSIFNKIANHFLIHVAEEEILFLATYLNNHNSISDYNYISPELTNFISESLELINEAFPSSLNDDVTLKLSLAFHCAPLISRVKNNVQIKNKMLVYVKQNFQYAFDIATYFVYLLSNKFECKISEDETAFIAIYFNRSLSEHQNQNGKKRLCIVTSLKRSAYFLLEQYLWDVFKQNICSITFLTNEEVEKADLEKFDVFFSTENGRIVESGLATKISCFPEEKEVEKMRAVIEDYGNLDSVIDMFDPRLFCIEEFEDKETAQNWLVKKAEKLYNIPTLGQEIELREQFGSTYFGNSIAILHPMHCVSNTSFIGSVILKKPIPWDDDANYVKTVFLVCLQKNNLSAFQTWDYISPIIFSAGFKKKSVDIVDFNSFRDIIIDMIKNR